MKRLISLITAIATIAIMASCSTEGVSPDNFDSYQIGTWTVVSPTQANWTGQQPTAMSVSGVAMAMASVDSVNAPKTLFRPHHNALMLGILQGRLAPSPQSIYVTYIDSLISYENIEKYDITIRSGLGHGGYAIPATPNKGYIQFNTTPIADYISCDSTYSGNERIHIIIVNTVTGDTVRNINLAVDGVHQVVQSMVCR